jgi:chloramphenicol-sensitive protein RarD
MLPLVSVALGTVFLHERPRPGQWLAVGIAAAGVAWLTWQTGRLPWAALALALSFGFYGLLRKTATLGALEGLSLETACCAAGARLSGLDGAGRPGGLDAGPGLLASLLAVGPITAVPLLLFAAGARRIPLATLGLLRYISPMLQFLLGVWLLGETASPARLVGFGLIWRRCCATGGRPVVAAHGQGHILIKMACSARQ